MPKHKLIELQKIIEVRIGSLIEEVEIATNVKLDPLYISVRKDDIVSLQWVTRIIRWVLDQAIEGRHYFGITQVRMESEDAKKFENILHDKIQELEIELEDSNTDREKEIIVNQVDTLKCVLDYLSDLKYGAETRAIVVANANYDFKLANRLRKKLIKFQDIEDEISAQCSSAK